MIYCVNEIQPRVTCRLVSVIYRAIRFLYWSLEIPTEGVIKHLKIYHVNIVSAPSWNRFWKIFRRASRASRSSLLHFCLHCGYLCTLLQAQCYWEKPQESNRAVQFIQIYCSVFWTVIIDITNSALAEPFSKQPIHPHETKKKIIKKSKASLWNRKPEVSSLWRTCLWPCIWMQCKDGQKPLNLPLSLRKPCAGMLTMQRYGIIGMAFCSD